MAKKNTLNTLVVGDLIIDQHIWCEVNRLSPEAPVPVCDVQKKKLFWVELVM